MTEESVVEDATSSIVVVEIVSEVGFVASGEQRVAALL